jgi:hypothetical protein
MMSGFYSAGEFGSSAGFGFTIGASGVTAMTLMLGTKTIPLTIPANETFVVDSVAGTVKATFTNTNSTAAVLYTQDAVNKSLYHVSSETTTITAPTTTTPYGTEGFNFIATGAVITGMQEVSTRNTTTTTHTLNVSPNAVFSGAVGATITETTVQGNSVAVTTFVQPVANGLYVEKSQSITLIQPGTATTLLDIEPSAHLNFTVAGNAVTQVQAISRSGVATTITPPTGVAFQEVTAGDPRFIEATFTWGTHTSYELFLLSTANGTYTEVAHGTGTAVDLVGINSQLSHVPAANLALI